MAKEIAKQIVTDAGEAEFQLRLIKDEGIGLATSRTGRNYLLLDSADYWYDAIQDSYPRVKKCSCKNEWFTLRFDYYYREQYDDIAHVAVQSTCSACGKTSTALSVDINYSPTDSLVANPLTLCKTPKIKYQYKMLSGYWTEDELLHIVRHCHDAGLVIYRWYWDKSVEKRTFDRISVEELAKIGDHFFCLYLANHALNIADLTWADDEKGIYLKENLWRRNELIEVNRSHMFAIGDAYLVQYATQFIDPEGITQNKSEQFCQKTQQLERYLSANFIGKRGKHCFDGTSGYEKYLASRATERQSA